MRLSGCPYYCKCFAHLVYLVELVVLFSVLPTLLGALLPTYVRISHLPTLLLAFHPACIRIYYLQAQTRHY